MLKIAGLRDSIFTLSNRYLATGGGVWMEVILSFLVAVMAGVVSHHINKWLDSKDTEDNK